MPRSGCGGMDEFAAEKVAEKVRAEGRESQRKIHESHHVRRALLQRF